MSALPITHAGLPAGTRQFYIDRSWAQLPEAELRPWEYYDLNERQRAKVWQRYLDEHGDTLLNDVDEALGLGCQRAQDAAAGAAGIGFMVHWRKYREEAARKLWEERWW
jgi:hypothetical protein